MTVSKTVALGLLCAAAASVALAGDRYQSPPGPPAPPAVNAPPCPTVPPPKAARPADHKALVAGLIEALKDEDNVVAQHVGNALACLGRTAVPGLLETLSERDKTVRCRAVEVLGRIGAARQAECVLPALTRALKDRDVEVRRAAACAITQVLGATVPPQPVAPVYAPACYGNPSSALPPVYTGPWR